MSREIRCRAWDKIEKKMWFPIVRPDGRLMAENQLGGYVTYDDPQDPLMQYTGLKDKNGKEIYEGDVVKAWNQDGFCFGVFPIEWADNSASFILDANGVYGVDEFNHADGIEVIGNIWENSELLEENE